MARWLSGVPLEACVAGGSVAFLRECGAAAFSALHVAGFHGRLPELFLLRGTACLQAAACHPQGRCKRELVGSDFGPTGSSSLRGSGSSVLHCGTVGTGYPGAMGALWSPGEGARGQACTGLGRLCTAPAEEAGTSRPDPWPPSFRQRSVRPHCASQGTQGRCAAWRVWEVCQRLTGRERQRLRSEECTERWRLTSLFTCHVPRPQHPPSDPRLCSWELRAVAREDRRQSEGTPALTLTPQGFLEVQVSCLSHPLIPAPAVCQAKRSFLKAALWAAPKGLLSGLLLDGSLCGSPGRSQPIAKQVPRSGLAGRHSW